MGDAIVHRGPDEQGIWAAPGVGFISRRLSIIDIKGSSQPIFNEAGDVVAIFNGELFDYIEQRKTLERQGHHFRTAGDGEILVHLWEQHGLEMFPHIQGQFAFALFDLRQRKLLLARDRVGVCPLHWAIRDRQLLFGSEIKAILASGRVRAEADILGLDNIFSAFCMPGSRTAFKDIQSLSPGSYITVSLDSSSDQLNERTYWDLSFPDQGEVATKSESQWVDEFDDVWQKAVRRRLRADVPVATYLSGGVDSALMLATATKISGRQPQAITARLAGALDEQPAAKQAAELMNVDQHVVDCHASELTKAFPDVIRAADCPVTDLNASSLLGLSKATHDLGYKVVLAGEGADEALAGYVWYKVRKFAGCLGWGPVQLGSWLMSTGLRCWHHHAPFRYFAKVYRQVGGAHAPLLMYHLSSYVRWNLLSEDVFGQLRGLSAFDQLGLPVERIQRWHPLNQSLYIGYKTMLPGLLLNHRGDRVAMANSVEVRYPFLDEDLISFCATVPPELKLRWFRRDKYLLRELAKRYLPEEIAQRPKAMFQADFAQAMLCESPAYVHQLLSTESLRATGYFDVVEVQKRFAALRTRGRVRRVFVEMALMTVIGTQLWHHFYLGGGLCEL